MGKRTSILTAINKQRITTKYSFPSYRARKRRVEKQRQRRKKAAAKETAGEGQHQQEEANEKEKERPPIARLTVKTFNAPSGICLKYQTDKVSEVGRLVTILGRLAGSGSGATDGGEAATSRDVEMVDASSLQQQQHVEEEAARKGGKGKTAKSNKKKGGGKGKR